VVRVTRTPAYLAALASSAVPGLDPVAVRAARGLPGNRCDVAFVTDTQRRAWVVRVPTTAAVGAQLDTSVPLLALISRRLPFQVPSPRGFVGVAEGRAMVYPFLHGRSVVLEKTPPGPGVAAELGRAVAALHNVDRAVFEEGGVAVYDSETYRRRHLADLDRAAATGHVPTGLLSRWERALEDVSAWRFAPTPVHGNLDGGRVLVSFTDEEDAGTATVRGVTGWEHAQVADPADDFAGVAEECSPEAFESVLEAYAVARIERPDRHLRLRARLAAELRALRRLLDAVTTAEPLLITRRAAELRALDERTADLPDLVPPPPVEPEPAPRAPAPIAGALIAGAAAPSPDRPADPAPARTGSHLAPEQHPPQDGADDRDTSKDTQRLRAGDAAEATTVIPPEELARLRSEAPEAPEAPDAGAGAAETTAVEVPVERTTAPDESWYQVIEPIAAHGPAEPGGHHPSEPAGGGQPTVVLVDSPSAPADPSPADPANPADSADSADPADPDPSEETDPDAAAPEAVPDQVASDSPARVAPRRRHRRATRP